MWIVVQDSNKAEPLGQVSSSGLATTFHIPLSMAMMGKKCFSFKRKKKTDMCLLVLISRVLLLLLCVPIQGQHLVVETDEPSKVSSLAKRSVLIQ